MEPKWHIGVAIERTSEYGRRFLQGLAEYFNGKADWQLDLINPAQISARIAGDHDGWICRITDNRALRLLQDTRKPVVDAICLNPMDGFLSIRSDNEAIGTLAADHFLAHRFTNFAFCGYRRISFSDLRRNAFAMHLEKLGFRTNIYRPPFIGEKQIPSSERQRRLAEGTFDDCDDVDALTTWLARLPKPVAVFCCDDFRASDVARVCKRSELVIPNDVAILGVDNDPVFCMFSSPRLSSIDPDAMSLGYAAAEMLCRRIVAPHENLPPVRVIPPKGIAVRASTDAYPGAPSWLAEALSYIQREFPSGISASDVFRHVGYSRTLVEKTFRHVLGKTVQEEIGDVRVRAAKRLLLTTALPAKEIARQTGYSSIEYFTRKFCAAVGSPPAAYRRQRHG